MTVKFCVLEGPAASLQTAAQLLKDEACDVVLFHLGPARNHKWFVVHRPEAITTAVLSVLLRFLPGYMYNAESNGTVVPYLPYHTMQWPEDTRLAVSLAAIEGAISSILGRMERIDYPIRSSD